MSFFNKLIKNDNFSEVLKGSFASLLTKGGGILLNYSLIFYLSTQIGVDYVGFYNLLFVFLFFTSVLCTSGLNYAIIPLLQIYSENKKKLYTKSLRIILSLLAITSLIFLTFSKSISNYLFSEFNTIVFGILLIMFLYVLLIFNIEFIRANKKIAISESLRNLSFPLLILLSIFFFKDSFENKYTLVLLGLFISVLLTFLPSLFYAIKNIGVSLKKNQVIKNKTLLQTAKPLMVVGLSSFFLSESSLFILKYYFDDTAVGSFTIVYKISIIACLVYTISSAIIGPKIAELFFAKNKIDLRKTFYSSFKFILLFSLPLFILVLLFPDFFLNIFELNSQYSTSLFVMVVSQFLYGVTAIYGLLLMVTNKQKVYRNIYIVSAFVNIILGFVLIPKQGVFGASIAVAISYLLLNFLTVMYTYKEKLI